MSVLRSILAFCPVLFAASSFGAAFESTAPALPGVGYSILRMMGALVVVLAVFLALVWIYRHWSRLAVTRGRSPQLQLLEVKPLGNRHALYVIGYQQQRLLVASSPGGVNLLTQLPEATAESSAQEPVAAPAFLQILQRALKPNSG